MPKWVTSNYPGVRYRVSETRKVRNGTADRYYAIRYRRDGRRVEEAVGWASEGWSAEMAHAILAELRTNIRTGTGPQSLADKRALADASRRQAADLARREDVRNMTLAEFVDQHFLPAMQRTKRTWYSDRSRLHSRVLPRFGAYPLAAVSRGDVQGLLDDLVAGGSAPATVRQYVAVIRRLYSYASQTVIDDVVAFQGENPTTHVEVPAVHNSRQRYLTHEEADHLIEEAGKLRLPDLREAIILGLNTGLRMGEMVRLTWLDVDIPGAIVSVPGEDRRKPGGKVPLNSDALQVFITRKDRLRNGRTDLVFPPVAGGRQRVFSEVFRTVANRCGLNDGIDDPRHRIVFHSLRHTFASWLALAGTDIYRIKALMRHKTITMTMRYAHLIPDATRDAVHNLRPPDR
jgi:integrase